MEKQRIGIQRCFEELNASYEKQDGYDPENRFRPSPDGAKGLAVTGYDFGGIGTSGVFTPAHQRALKDVMERFEIDVMLP